MKYAKHLVPVIFLVSCQAEFKAVDTASETSSSVVEVGDPPPPSSGDARPLSPDTVIEDSLLLSSVEVVVEKSVQPVEVFVGIDSSGSMKKEIGFLEQSIPKFVNDLSATEVPFLLHFVYDFSRINLVIDDAVNDKVMQSNMPIGSNNAISVLNQFFDGYTSSLKDARMDIVITSDDDGKGDGNLADDFEIPVAGARVHAMVGQAAGQDPQNADCNIKRAGEQHIKLAEKTNGSNHNLCMREWDKLVEEIVKLIKQDAKREIQLDMIDGNAKPVYVEYAGSFYKLNDEGSPFKAQGSILSIAADFQIKIADRLKVLYQSGTGNTTPPSEDAGDDDDDDDDDGEDD
ncbi:hypothetical protein [Pseudobacteriovorax antillogorgiicola]|uniref:Uncharacterized protein n=1 Tax=Pseudobacteriovorax antillogorgiicola TaxID=1513793 RepID=A0A1Y6BF43_9BACT|nr:hypothetical protein [Pseudobacteriovorax antillogorgiicola]TCS56337.1 hypothetical protein EDD56_104159 [Pseudobacteriovorax antillogorgiicola]SMF06910.1 hypothetical protein SAMN06296036_104174 [Pseudobacteriovorax antillogorgiicola]